LKVVEDSLNGGLLKSKTKSMDAHLFSFEKLEVWQLARLLSKEIYEQTKSFPPEEKFSLTSQLRRSVLAIGANIAEGTARSSAKEQAHFTTIAYSSLMEVFNHMIVAYDVGIINEATLIEYRKRIQILSIKLSNLKASQIKRMGKIGS